MPWFKVDDNLHSHNKARTAGLQALGLWVVAGSYCGQYTTEGRVPAWFVASWPSGPKLAAQLVRAGLWCEVEGEWQFHQWDERQPSKEQVEAERARTRERQQKWRDRKRDKPVTEPVTNAGSNGVTNGVTNSAPSRPDPSLKPFSSDEPPREEVEALCKQLADRIEGNGVNRPDITEGWRTACRRMLDIDKRDPVKASHLIDWCQADSFWRANILSMPKFRTQYEQLRLKALEDWEKRKEGGLSPDGDVNPDAVLGADSWSLPDPPEGVEPGSTGYQTWARGERDSHKAARVAQARARLERVSA